MTTGNLDVQITNEKNQPVPAQVEDNEDGTYSVAYTTSAPGPLKVNVLHVEKVLSATTKFSLARVVMKPPPMAPTQTVI